MASEATPDAVASAGRMEVGPLDPARFRAVMGRFATGVTVMTALDADGVPGAMTANSVSSVSLHPLLVLVCVGREADMATRVVAGRRFALSILGAGSEPVSNRFADRERSLGWDALEDVPWAVAATGVPILRDAIGWLDCLVHDVFPGGDHLIVVGAVQAADVGPSADALGTFHGGYTAIPRP